MPSKGTRHPGAPRKPVECLEARPVDSPRGKPRNFRRHHRDDDEEEDNADEEAGSTHGDEN